MHSDPKPLKLQDFAYDLPAELIAQQPLAERAAARLLLHTPAGDLRHHHVSDLPKLLKPQTLFLYNNTQVFPSRLWGSLPSGGKVELFLLQAPSGGEQAQAQAIGRPMKKLSVGTRLALPAGLFATVKHRFSSGSKESLLVEFSCSCDDFFAWARQHGYVPLPPYIKRQDLQPAANSPDLERYQTVYAATVGAVAAPTAGLHLTAQLMQDLLAQGINLKPITLHVGAGTFMPVSHDNIAEHPMHTETYLVSKDTLQSIEAARSEKQDIVALGTTTLRCVEALYQKAAAKACSPFAFANTWQSTDLFIWPKTRMQHYHSPIFSGIMTNFHQPQSTLFMLICALLGYTKAQELYACAVAEKYRFFSYGDTSLLFFPKPD